MAKSTVTSSSRNVQNSEKGYSYSSVLVAVLAVAGAYLYFDRCCMDSTLNRFSEVFCDKLSAQAAQKTEASTDITPEVAPKLTRSSAYDPKLTGGKSYNAKGSQTRFFRTLQKRDFNLDYYGMSDKSKSPKFLVGFHRFYGIFLYFFRCYGCKISQIA